MVYIRALNLANHRDQLLDLTYDHFFSPPGPKLQDRPSNQSAAFQSQAIKTPNAIYCSGQIPCDKDGKLVEGTTREKTAACIKNLQAVLTEAGSSIAKVVKVNVFITDMSDFKVRSP